MRRPKAWGKEVMLISTKAEDQARLRAERNKRFLDGLIGGEALR